MPRMVYEKPKPKHRRPDYLTAEESQLIDELENAQRLSAQMRLDHVTIRNRAIQRALRAAAKRSA